MNDAPNVATAMYAPEKTSAHSVKEPGGAFTGRGMGERTDSMPNSRSQNTIQFVNGQIVHPNTAEPNDFAGTVRSNQAGWRSAGPFLEASISAGRQYAGPICEAAASCPT
eukprot:scaffold187933_cov29-Tisochrysis_lutea.AAC.4